MSVLRCVKQFLQLVPKASLELQNSYLMRFKGFVLALFTPFVLNAQKNFRPGNVVTLQNDTISGFIDYKEWQRSPTSILFKSSENNATLKEYTVNDLSSFTITGNEAYLRSPVKISLNPTRLADIGGRDTSWKIDTVFLKVIHSSKLVSLLSYTDKLKERFYILENGQKEPTELILREYLKDGSVSLIDESTYKAQLESLLYRKGTYTAEVGERIKEAAYDEDDLKKIVVLINRANKEEQVEEKAIRRTFWFAGVGLQSDRMTFTGDHQMSRYPHTSQSGWLPRISAGFDFFANPSIGKIFYRLEAGYDVNKSTITTSFADNVKAVYGVSGSTVSFRAQINYTPYNTNRLKIPIGVGAVYSHYSYSKNQYKKVYPSGEENNQIENWLDLNKSAITYFLRGSLVLNNKIEASFAYNPFTSITKTIVYSVGRSSMQLQVYYLFRKKK